MSVFAIVCVSPHLPPASRPDFVFLPTSITAHTRRARWAKALWLYGGAGGWLVGWNGARGQEVLRREGTGSFTFPRNVLRNVPSAFHSHTIFFTKLPSLLSLSMYVQGHLKELISSMIQSEMDEHRALQAVTLTDLEVKVDAQGQALDT